jgi:hypothetical protein
MKAWFWMVTFALVGATAVYGWNRYETQAKQERLLTGLGTILSLRYEAMETSGAVSSDASLGDAERAELHRQCDESTRQLDKAMSDILAQIDPSHEPRATLILQQHNDKLRRHASLIEAKLKDEEAQARLLGWRP